jgi:hypothetical protein
MFLDNFGIYSDDKVLLAKSFHFSQCQEEGFILRCVVHGMFLFRENERAAYLFTTPVGDVTIAEIPTPL